tara:strand:- start:38 stop:469 length:432 start_codon:yes stop_codon:yes gene_type:complete
VSKVENGSNVSVHYRGTLNNGEQFDSSYDRGEPIGFTVGSGQMIAGFDAGVVGMAVGEKKTITLTPDQAYGETNPEAIQEFSKDKFPPDFEFIQDGHVQGQTGDGRTFNAVITEINENTVTLDLNHPMAGKDLNFEIELVSID